MALKKEIELDNGIITNYHRIVSLNKITNQSNMIEVANYTSKEQREKEKEYQTIQNKNIAKEKLSDDEKTLLNKGINVFINTMYIAKEYDENEKIEDVYEFLKTTKTFENSIDD